MPASKPVPSAESPAPKPARKRTDVVRTYGGVGPDERRAERRRRLLDAALVVFGQHGYHDATVRQVCTEARLTERYFYESFKSMSELFVALYNRLNSELMARTMAALQTSRYEPMALAETALRAFYGFIQNNPARARVLLIDTVSVNARTTGAANDAVRDYSRLVRQFITALYPDAASMGLEIGMIIAGLLGSTIHTATHWARDDFNKPLDQVVAINMMSFQGMHLLHQHLKAEATRKTVESA